MTQPYIGRAAEAAARAKHNRIHKVKKTAKKRPAKKAPTKATKAIEEALGAFKLHDQNHEFSKEISKEIQKGSAITSDPDEWTEYGPLGGQDEDAIAREVLGMDYGVPEEPVVAQEVPSEAFEPAPAQVVPEDPTKAPQAISKMPRTPQDDLVVKCILNLIDALNFLYREGYLRKLPEKDILILKQRIRTGRQLIEKL